MDDETESIEQIQKGKKRRKKSVNLDGVAENDDLRIETKKRKKLQKLDDENTESISEMSSSVEESNQSKISKKKRKMSRYENDSKNKIQELITETSQTKKKDKNIQLKENAAGSENSYSEIKPKKKKKLQKLDDENMEPISELSSSVDESNQSKILKKKHKMSNSENDTTNKIQEPITDTSPTKKKHKNKQLKENITDSENIYSEIKNKKKKSKNSDHESTESSLVQHSSAEETPETNIKKKKRKHAKLKENSIDPDLEKFNNKNGVEESNKSPKRRLYDAELFDKIVIKEEYLSSNDTADERENTNTTPKNSSKEIKNSTSMIVEKINFAKAYSQNTEVHKKIPSSKNIKEELQEVNSEIPDIDDSNEVSYNEMKSIVKMEFIMPFDVPELHSLHARTSVVPKAVREYIAKNKIYVKTGPYTSEEDEQILKNWKLFCEKNNLDENNPMPFLTLKKKSMPRFKISQFSLFLQFLGHKLDNRLLNGVYDRFKRLINDNKKRFNHFTKKEDEIILDYLRNGNSQHPIVDLAKILHRDKVSVNKRIFYLNNIKNSKFESHVSWTVELVNQIIQLIMDETNLEEIKDLQHYQINKNIWRSLSETTKIPIVKLKKRWNLYIYPGLFLPHDVDFSLVLSKMINLFKENKYRELRQVNWNTIASKINETYSGFRGALLHKMVIRLLSDVDLDNNSFDQAIQHIENIIKKNGSTLFNNMVPKLTWDENGYVTTN